MYLGARLAVPKSCQALRQEVRGHYRPALSYRTQNLIRDKLSALNPGSRSDNLFKMCDVYLSGDG